jgi:hypothetical protein
MKLLDIWPHNALPAHVEDNLSNHAYVLMVTQVTAPVKQQVQVNVISLLFNREIESKKRFTVKNFIEDVGYLIRHYIRVIVKGTY